MATTNFYIAPADGWTQVAEDGAYLRVSSGSGTPFYVAVGSAAPSGGAQATGTITFTGLPVADETVTVNGQVYVFKASASTALQVTIGADGPATATNLATKINANSTAVTASVAAGVVTLHALAAGAAGNAVTLTETATNVAASGATLAGGVDAQLGMLMTAGKSLQIQNTFTGKVFVRTIARNGPSRIDVIEL